MTTLTDDFAYEVLSSSRKFRKAVSHLGQIARLIGKKKTPDWLRKSCRALNIMAISLSSRRQPRGRLARTAEQAFCFSEAWI